MGKGRVWWIKGLILDHRGPEVKELILPKPQVKQLQVRANFLKCHHWGLVLWCRSLPCRTQNPTQHASLTGGSDLNTERKQPRKGQDMRNHICIMT